MGDIRGSGRMVETWHGNSYTFGELIEKVKPGAIIEVGTWKGGSAITMARKVKELGLDCMIYCVDTWLGGIEHYGTIDLHLKAGYPQIYFEFLENIQKAGVADIIQAVPNTSAIASRILAYYNVRADLIYIDASHHEDDVYDDLVNYWKLLSNEGTMFGDDYNFKGVKKAVNRFADEHNLEISIADNVFWVLCTGI